MAGPSQILPRISGVEDQTSGLGLGQVATRALRCQLLRSSYRAGQVPFQHCRLGVTGSGELHQHISSCLINRWAARTFGQDFRLLQYLDIYGIHLLIHVNRES